MTVAGFFDGAALAVTHTDLGFLLAGFLAACAIFAFMLWAAGPRFDDRRGGEVDLVGVKPKNLGPYDQADHVDYDALWDAVARKDPGLQRLLHDIASLPEDAA